MAVLVLRHPLEVARSLQARNGFTLEKGLRLWLRHVLEAERETRAIPRTFVRYADVLADWRAAARAIASDLRLRWPARKTQAIARHLDAGLRHQRAGRAAIRAPAPLARQVSAAWGLLKRLDQGRAVAAAQARLDRLLAGLERPARKARGRRV
jgi:hypothetical protein